MGKLDLTFKLTRMESIHSTDQFFLQDVQGMVLSFLIGAAVTAVVAVVLYMRRRESNF